MATKLLCLSLLILNLLLHMSTTAESAAATTDFIKSSCKATRYPVACVESLSGYASKIRQSEEELASTALSVSVSKTRSCVSSLEKMEKTKGLKVRENNAVQDCIENMNDSVDNLNRSLKELGLLGNRKGKDSRWHISNIQTWVSAAMTYQDTCLDSIDDANSKSSIKPKVVDASQVTSNALALVNRFASKYRT
ncbi:21 kDa protein-like [Vigna umbellata]|uniref:21 kDa protein-like n=1 Tax=Vigna umbellata TaxID=87088 RepID=UPI001F5F6E6B|nr:21 kDa protein-like [Vigna umbellata]